MGITYDQLNGQLKKTDCAKVINDHAPKLANNDTCWHHSKPRGCPKGYIKYDTVHLVDAKVGQSAVTVGPRSDGKKGNEVSLVVGNITMAMKPTKFTAQPE